MPDVRIAITSWSPISRPIAKSAAKSVANGKAIDSDCGMRRMTNRSTRKIGACWLMRKSNEERIRLNAQNKKNAPNAKMKGGTSSRRM